MDIILSLILCFLSVYGFFHLIYSFACKGIKPPENNLICAHSVVITDDSSGWLEGYVRALALSDYRQTLFIIDNSSESETAQLLKILNAEFDFVEVVTLNEYIKYVEMFGSVSGLEKIQI